MVGCAASSPANNVTATPAFSPAGGSYNSSQTVTIAESTKGAVLYCTTDGTTPTTSSPQCSQPTTVYKSEFLQAIAAAPNMAVSSAASAGYTINLSAAATPTFSPAGGAYAAGQAVIIAAATAGANIFYTTDGSIPTGSSTLYTGPLTISNAETVSAIALVSGFSNSGVASSAYTIVQAVTATPVFSVPAGTYTAAQTVSLSDATTGAAIFYTIDGSAPSSSSTPYTGPITVSQTEELSTIAVASGISSPLANAFYTISLPQSAMTPTFSVPAGSYASAQTVTLSDATGGATIYYTLNGSAPTASSTLYTSPLTVSATETISAIATASGFLNSAVASVAYTIIQTATATPVISPASSSYNSALQVTITDATAGAAIYYTIDGSTPTPSSALYSGPITVSSTETIHAIAAVGNNTSAVATATITISVGGLKLNGNVFSGTAAVMGAQVQLYSAGRTGYGSAPTAVLSTPVVTDANGAFTFTYNCPASPGNLVYLVASGGNVGGVGANSSLRLMAALGSCSSAAASVSAVINEVTTVASAYALAQFAVPNPSGAGILIGTSTGNLAGLASSMKTVSNLVDPVTGAALTITPFYRAMGGTSGGILNSSYVPQARIDTLANILNACVNSNGTSGGCSNLFSAATPVSGTAPADTLQAILSIAQHPGSNAATLYGLSSLAAPFQPSLSSAPTDWTLALTFTGGGLGIAPGSNPGSAALVTSMALDASGNIWATVGPMCFDPTLGVGVGVGLIEFDNQGNALSPAATASNLYCAGYQPKYNGASVGVGSSIAFDLNGSIWVSNSTKNLPFAKLSSDGTVQGEFAGSPEPASLGFNAHSSACFYIYSLAIDAANNVWAGCTDGGSSGNLSVISATDGSPVSATDVYGTSSKPVNFLPIGSIALDSLGNAWGVATADPSTAKSNLYQTKLTGGLITVTSDHSTSGSTFAGSVVADGLGDVFSPGATPGTISALGPDQTTVHNFTYPLPSGALGVSQLALDGAGNIWGASYSAGSNVDTTTPSYLVEMTKSGTILSPSSANVYGYTGTGGGGETQPILADAQFGPTTYGGIAVDGSGNVWVTNNEMAFAGFDINLPGEQLVEFIGVAAPILTPTSVALQNGQVGVRP